MTESPELTRIARIIDPVAMRSVEEWFAIGDQSMHEIMDAGLVPPESHSRPNIQRRAELNYSQAAPARAVALAKAAEILATPSPSSDVGALVEHLKAVPGDSLYAHDGILAISKATVLAEIERLSSELETMTQSAGDSMTAHFDALQAKSAAEALAETSQAALGVAIKALEPFAAVWDYDDVPRHFPDMIYLLNGVRLNLIADDLRRAAQALQQAGGKR